MYAPPISAPSPPTPPTPPDPYTSNVMSYADKVKQLLASQSAPPTTGALPGTPPENPDQDNMTINARSGEYVFPEPAVKYYGVKKLETMVQKAIEDIKPPAQPAPEPPTQAQTFAKGGLINRKHFMKVPTGHAYDKMSPKSHPKASPMMPTGMPPAPSMDPSAMPMDPSAMDPSAMGAPAGAPQMGPPQMGPPAQPTQPPLPHYWGGGLVWNNPDYWSGRDRADRFGDIWDGPSVQTFPSRPVWNPNAYPPDLPPMAPQPSPSGPDYNLNPHTPHTPPRHAYAGGGQVVPDQDEGPPGLFGAHSNPGPLYKDEDAHAGHYLMRGKSIEAEKDTAMGHNIDNFTARHDFGFSNALRGIADYLYPLPKRGGQPPPPEGATYVRPPASLATVQGYARGGITGLRGGISGIDNPFAVNAGGLDPRSGAWYYGAMSRMNPYVNPFSSSGPGPGFNAPPGTPGAGQGPTYNPSYFDPQGYPWAQPAPISADDPQGSGPHHHTPPKQTS